MAENIVIKRNDKVCKMNILEEYGLAKEDYNGRINWKAIEQILTDATPNSVEKAEEEVFEMLMENGDSYFILNNAVKFFRKMDELDEKDSKYLELLNNKNLWFNKSENHFRLVRRGRRYTKEIEKLTEKEIEEVLGSLSTEYKLINVFSKEEAKEKAVKIIEDKLNEFSERVDKFDARGLKKEIFNYKLNEEEERIRKIKNLLR